MAFYNGELLMTEESTWFDLALVVGCGRDVHVAWLL